MAGIKPNLLQMK